MTRDSDDNHVDAGANTDSPGAHKPCYPPSIEFASEPSANASNVDSGRRSRRPGGSMRGAGPWHTAACHGDEGRPHAMPDERSPNPTPGLPGMMLNIGKEIVKGIETKAKNRLSGESSATPSGQHQPAAAGGGAPYVPPLAGGD